MPVIQAVKISSSEKNDEETRSEYAESVSQTEIPKSASSSFVSMMSEQSISAPPAFQKKKNMDNCESESPGISHVLMNTHQSLDAPSAFTQETTEKPMINTRMITKRNELVSADLSHVSMKTAQSLDAPATFSSKLNISSYEVNVSMGLPGRAVVTNDDLDNLKAPSDTAKPDQAALHKFKTAQQEKIKMIKEGIPIDSTKKLLNEVFTEVYIIDCECDEVNDEHEVKEIEKPSRRLINENNNIHCTDIFKPLPGREKPIRTVLTKGIAGIGKTVSVQKFTLDWSEGKANQELDLIFPLVFKKLNFIKQKECSLMDLLHEVFPETKDLKVDNDNYKVLFILDGLDEGRFPLDFQNNRRLSDIKEAALVDVLLTNLIAGNLLPSALLWITSRPAATNQLPACYIDRITVVRGFNDPQKEEYIKKRISDQVLANNILTHLKASRSLYIMCHIPVFCWVSTKVLESMLGEVDGKEVPKTLTQMFTNFLFIQLKIRTMKYQKREKTDLQWNDLILKLGKLAFHQLEKGNLIFYQEDLTECGLNVKEASVYSGICTQIFIEESFMNHGKMFSFVHLSVQEHIAAVYAFIYCITGNQSGLFGLSKKIQLSEFLKNSVDKALESKNGHLDLFLRFLLGLSMENNQHILHLLLTESQCGFHDASVRVELIKYIKKKIKAMSDPEKCINLFHCLNELNDSSLVQEVQRYLNGSKTSSLHGVKLSTSQWSALVFVILNSEDELKEFYLNKYEASEECLLHLLPVIKASVKAVLCDSNLKKKSCQALAKVLCADASCLQELDLSGNELSNSGIKELFTGFKSPNFKLRALRLNKCGLTEKSCEYLTLALKTRFSTALCWNELSLSQNPLQDSGVMELSRALQNLNGKLETLRLNSCSFTAEGFRALISALESKLSHLRELDVGGNQVSNVGAMLIADLLKNPNCKLVILKLSGCNISADGCAALHAALSSNPSSQLRELDLTKNNLGERGLNLLSAFQHSENYRLEKLLF